MELWRNLGRRCWAQPLRHPPSRRAAAGIILNQAVWDRVVRLLLYWPRFPYVFNTKVRTAVRRKRSLANYRSIHPSSELLDHFGTSGMNLAETAC
ncbi:hypothetical protein GN956_G9921 [Arapaima gigas]